MLLLPIVRDIDAAAMDLEGLFIHGLASYRNQHDQLAFAVHAYLIADGYRLTATGKAADVPDEGAHLHLSGRYTCDMSGLVWSHEMSCAAAEIPKDKKRSSVKGWNQMEDGYAFRYEDPTGRHHPAQQAMYAAYIT